MHLLLASALLHLLIPIQAAETGKCYLKDLKDLDGVSPESQIFTLSGNKAIIICNEGFSLKSNMPLCANGRWKPDNETLCEESNCEIPRINGGSVKEETVGEFYWSWQKVHWERKLSYLTIEPGNFVSSGRQLWLFCDIHYSVNGDGTQKIDAMCSKGRWSKDLKCLRSKCYLKDLKDLDGVSPESQIFTLSGNKVKIMCNEGFSLKSNMPLCANGRWKPDNEILCEESNCEIPRINGGSVKEETIGENYWNWQKFLYERKLSYLTIAPGNVVSSGTLLKLFCNKSYSVNGDGEQKIDIMCSKGRWSKDVSCLRDGERYVPSTIASVLKQSVTTLESTHSDSVTTVSSLPLSTTSNSRSEVSTSPVSVDVEKRTTIVTPHPLPGHPQDECFCEYPVVDKNVVAHSNDKRLEYGDRVRSGGTVVFRCLHVGYHRFTGHQKITCDCQPWPSRVFPSCTAPTKGDVGILFDRKDNILANGSIEIQRGQRVKFTCVAMETAKYPEWTPPNTFGVSYIQERKEREDYGDVLYLTHLEILKADYEHEGKYECSLDGGNKTMIYVKVVGVRCPELKTVDLLQINYSRDREVGCIAKFQCFLPGKLSGVSLTHCLENGTWADPTPTCTNPDIRCPEFPADDKIVIKYEMNRRESSRATFSCPKEGQDLVGNSVVICLNSGQWSDPPPHCSDVRCPELKTVDLLQINYSRDREVGSIATFQCFLPGKLSGVSLTHCLENGTWADPTPTCTSSECSVHNLSLPINMQPDMTGVNGEFVPTGTEVGLKCTENYIMVGNPKATCGEHGKWMLGGFRCASGCFFNVDPHSDLLIEPVKDIYRFGEFVLLSCPRGKTMSRKVERLLCLGSRWSEALPKCEESK